MRIEKTKEDWISTTWKVYITNDDRGPFYEIGKMLIPKGLVRHNYQNPYIISFPDLRSVFYLKG